MIRIGCIATGSYLLWFAHGVFWSNSNTLWYWQLTVFSSLFYFLAFLLIGIGVLNKSPYRWQILVLVGITVAFAANYYVQAITLQSNAYGTTDAALFSSFAAHLQILGENPYTWSVPVQRFMDTRVDFLMETFHPIE